MGKLLLLKKAVPNRAAIIDEFGDVCALRAGFAPTEKRHKQLADEIKSWYEDAAAAREFTEKGDRYQLAISMRSLAKTINIRAAYKKLGINKFLAACTITLKALGELLSEPEVDALWEEDRTGHRSYVTTPFAVPAELMLAQPNGTTVVRELLGAAK